MAEKSEGALFAELGGRVLAGALGWLLVLLGVLGVVATLLRALGNTAPTSTTGTVIALGVSVLVIAIGIYGNPRLRERIHAYRG